MYRDFAKEGIRRTVISFEPFLRREDVRGLTDAQVGKKFGLSTQTVKAMRRHQDGPFETIRVICPRSFRNNLPVILRFFLKSEDY